MVRTRVAAGLCALVLSVAACGDFTSSGDPLTDAEAAELAAVMADEGFPGFGGAASPSQSPGANDAADATITITINDSGPCEGGGTVAVAGELQADVDDQAGTGSLQYEYVITPNHCVVTTESAKVFTISGDPNITGSGELNFGQESWSGMLRYEGKFTWEEGDRAGACGINLEVTYDFQFGGTTVNASASLTGEVCGVTVNRTIELQDFVA